MSTKHDPFCWHCHKSDTNLKCCNCIRSYHADCANEVERNVPNPDEWLCLVCVSLEANENMAKIKELKMMPLLIKRFKKVFGTLKDSMGNPKDFEQDTTNSFVNPIKLKDIIKNSAKYTNLMQFYLDICWIAHNCVIMYTDEDQRANQAKFLLEYIANEIANIRECAECYINMIKRPKIWFTLPCSEPHLIIWAKLPNDTYWPAKVITIQEQQVIVRFFGTHKRGSVSAANCRLYSNSILQPTNILGALYYKARKEARKYINKIYKKYDSFDYAEPDIVFEPTLLPRYVEQMIPKIVEYRRSARNGIEISSDLYDDTIILLSDDDDDDDDTYESEGDLEQSHNLIDSLTHDLNGAESVAPNATEEAFGNDTDKTSVTFNFGDDLEGSSRGAFSQERSEGIDGAKINELNNAPNENNSEKVPEKRCSEDMIADESELPKKRVRFSDEWGKNLTEVYSFISEDTMECDQEDGHNHDSHDKNDGSESGDSNVAEIDEDSSMGLFGSADEISTTNSMDPYSPMKMIQKYMNQIQNELPNVANLEHELKSLKEAHSACEMTKQGLFDQLDAVKCERNKAVSEAEETVSRLTQSHNVEVADLKQKVERIANEKFELEQSQRALNGLHSATMDLLKDLEADNAEQKQKNCELRDEIAKIKESHRMEIDEKNNANARLKAQLQEKMNENVSFMDQLCRDEMDFISLIEKKMKDLSD